MFDILFGWRKASKCKNLVRRAQCRLKLLKIKRHSIVRQLRDDIAQLLKNGHIETAFSRVEQVFKDQSLLAAYDLLDYFCEFIIIHFAYIRKHKYQINHVLFKIYLSFSSSSPLSTESLDCPNDINEAVSTLIFAACWCGDLPELKMIQKLFGERYGHKFAKAAIELHPGTLVNNLFREKLCIKSMPDNAKIRLIDEIGKEYSLQQDLLFCDNRLKLNLPKLCGNSDCQLEGFVFTEEAEVNCNSSSGAPILATYNEDRLTERCLNSNLTKLTVEPLQVNAMRYQPRTTLSPLSGQTILESCSSSKPSTVSLDKMVEMGSAFPPSDISFQFHKSIVNSAEAQEFQFSTGTGQFDEDKRTFLFINSSIFPVEDCSAFGGASFLFLSNHGYGEHEIDRHGSCNRVACLRNSDRKSNGKKLKRIYSKEREMYQSCLSPILMVENTECEQYYGEFFKFSQNQEFIFHQCGLQGKHWRKMIPPQACRGTSFFCDEKLWSSEELHYTRMSQQHVCCDMMQGRMSSGKCKFNHTRSHCRCIFSQDMDFNCSLEHPCYYNVMEFHNDTPIKKRNKLGVEILDFLASCASSLASSSKESSEHLELETGSCAPYAKIVTMSAQKLKGTTTENNLQSASSQLRHSERSTNSPHGHVHPKLPDYDELEAKFMALKKEHQKRRAAGS